MPRLSRLEFVTPADYDFIYSLHIDGDALTRYRLRANTPGPETFLRYIWDGVVAQFLVVSLATQQPVGLVSCYHADHRNQHAHVSVIAAPDSRSSGVVVEAMAAFISYCFESFPFRKLYAEVLGDNLGGFGSGAGNYFEIEGRFRDHEYLDGEWVDLVTLAFHRESWSGLHDSHLERS